MSGFRWAMDLNGHKNPILRECYITAATAVTKYSPVTFTQGTAAPGITPLTEALAEDFDDPIYGIAMEAHDGSTSGRQSGTKIEVSVSPSAIYSYRCKTVLTLTGGSTTTAVCSALEPSGTDNFWKNGAIKILSCAANSDLVGRIVKISSSTGSGGTLTLAETLPSALASGDTINLCPGNCADDYLGFDLWYNSTEASGTINKDINWAEVGGSTLRIMWSDPDNMTTYVKFEKSAAVS